MRTLRNFSVTCWIFVISGCGTGPSNEPAPDPNSDPTGTGSETNELNGTYDYRGIAEDGAVVGTLTLQFEGRESPSVAPIRVFGSWVLAAEGLVGEIGPQIGSGQLEGEFRPDGSIHLGLNPGMADNNVSLVGSLDPSGRSFSGTWDYSNFTGHVTGGTFDADQR